MVIRRHACDRYRYSASLHSNKSNHEANQAKVKKNEGKVDSQDQGRS